MGTLLLYKPSPETASKILEFFETHPNKDYCVVGIEGNKETVYWRKDIPRLEAIAKSKGSGKGL